MDIFIYVGPQPPKHEACKGSVVKFNLGHI